MKKLFCSIALLSASFICLASSTTLQIQGYSIQFNCIPALDSIISAVPSTINSFTMDLENACDSLSAAAQAYEDAAAASSNFQVQGDYYYNAAQAYYKACTLVLNTTNNFGAIGDAQDITYIQSYRCSALQAFNQSFEAYLTLCMNNLNTSQAKSIADNATVALSDFLVNLIALNKQQTSLLQTLEQSSPMFASYLKPDQSTTCSPFTWYPITLPGEEIANCDYQMITIPDNPTQYSGLTSYFNSNSPSNVQEDLGFPAGNPDVPTYMMQVTGALHPGANILNETLQSNSHAQGWLSGTNPQDYLGSYVANSNWSNQATATTQLFDIGQNIGGVLFPSQIPDPYSINDPKNNPSSSTYDENFANIIHMIPQPEYIYATPTPTTVQTLHDAIKDYMYSADIHKMDSYIYNAYINITAKNTFPNDILPAIRRMSIARMKVVECYEGALIKIIFGLTGKSSIAPSAWSNLTGDDQVKAAQAAQCLIYIMPMYNAMIQQIAKYDIPFLSALSAIQSSTSGTPSQIQAPSASESTNQAASDALANAQKVAQTAATDQATNQQNAQTLALNQQAATTQFNNAQASSQAAAASAAQAASSAQEAANESTEAARELQQISATVSSQYLTQATTAANQTQAPAGQAATAASQAQQAATAAANDAAKAQQAALTGDLATATAAATDAATQATTASTLATQASTYQKATEQAAVTALNLTQAAQASATQAVTNQENINNAKTAVLSAMQQIEAAISTAYQQSQSQLNAAVMAAENAGVSMDVISQITTATNSQLSTLNQQSNAGALVPIEQQAISSLQSGGTSADAIAQINTQIGGIPASINQITQQAITQITAAQQTIIQQAAAAAAAAKAAADKAAADKAAAAAAAQAYATQTANAQTTAIKQIITQALSDQSSPQIQSAMGQTVIPETLNPVSSASPATQVNTLQTTALKCITRITTLSDPSSAANNNVLIVSANQGAVALMQQAQQMLTQNLNPNETGTAEAQDLQTAAQAWTQMIPTLTGYAQQYPTYAAIFNGFVTLCNQYIAALNKQAQQLSSGANANVTANQTASQNAVNSVVAAQATASTSAIGQTAITNYTNPAQNKLQQAQFMQSTAQQAIGYIASLGTNNASQSTTTIATFINQIQSPNIQAAALYEKAQQLLLQAVSANLISNQQAAASWTNMLPVLQGYAQQNATFAPIFNGFIQLCNQYAGALIASSAPNAVLANPQPVNPPPVVNNNIAPTKPTPVVQNNPTQAPQVTNNPPQPATNQTASIVSAQNPPITVSQTQPAIQNMIANMFAQYENTTGIA